MTRVERCEAGVRVLATGRKSFELTADEARELAWCLGELLDAPELEHARASVGGGPNRFMDIASAGPGGKAGVTR